MKIHLKIFIMKISLRLKNFISAFALFVIVALSSNFYGQAITVQNTSSPTACDGSAMLDSTVAVSNINWYVNGMVQSGSYYLGGLCPGTYMVTFNDNTGAPNSLTFVIQGGAPNPCSGFTVTCGSTNVSAALACDGSATVTATGGTAPYSLVWSNGSVMWNLGNLCVGSYSCTVADANGCSGSSTANVSFTLPQDSVLIFNNNSFPGMVVIDSLQTVYLINCTLDYDAVDSAYISSYTNTSPTTVLVNWTIIDTNGVVMIVYPITYNITNPLVGGVFSATLIVYCGSKSTNHNTLHINDAILYILEVEGIDETAQETYSVVNPINDFLSINFNKTGDYNIVLTDLRGAVIVNTHVNQVSQFSLNTADLKSGSYLLTVNGRTKHLIK